MMKKHVLYSGLFAALLLTGCSSGESSENENTVEENQVTTTEMSSVLGETNEEEKSILESPYKEIKQHFKEWELPSGGEPSDEFFNSVRYENGYFFDKDSGVLVAREWEDGSGKPEPTEDQKVGVIMGLLSDASDLSSHSGGESEAILGKIEEAKSLNDYEPLEDWLIDAEEIFINAEGLEGERSLEYYDKGDKELQKMSSLIFNVEDL